MPGKTNEKRSRVVAVVGMCGSGKSVVTSFFEERGWRRIYFGGVTMRELEKRGLEKTEANERKVREELRAVYGMGAFAELLLPDIREAAAKGDAVLDGLYRQALPPRGRDRHAVLRHLRFRHR